MFCYAILVCKVTHQLRGKKPCFIASCEVSDTLEMAVRFTLHLRSFRIIQRAKSSGLQCESFGRKEKKSKAEAVYNILLFNFS